METGIADHQTLVEVVRWANENLNEHTKYWLLGVRDAKAMSVVRLGVRHPLARGWTNPIMYPFFSEFKEAVRAEFGPYAVNYSEDVLDGVLDKLLENLRDPRKASERNSLTAESGVPRDPGCSVSGPQDNGPAQT